MKPDRNFQPIDPYILALSRQYKPTRICILSLSIFPWPGAIYIISSSMRNLLWIWKKHLVDSRISLKILTNLGDRKLNLDETFRKAVITSTAER